MKKPKSKKFLVGEFSFTDKKGRLSLSAFVETKNIDAYPLFWLSLKTHDESFKATMYFNSIELRALSTVFLKKDVYTKHSGGDTHSKQLLLKPESFSLKLIKSGNESIFHFNNEFEYKAFGEEIDFLITTTMSSVYKTQQFLKRKLMIEQGLIKRASKVAQATQGKENDTKNH